MDIQKIEERMKNVAYQNGKSGDGLRIPTPQKFISVHNWVFCFLTLFEISKITSKSYIPLYHHFQVENA